MVSTERKAAATIARSGAYLPQLDGLRALAILAVNSGRTEWREEAKAHIGETAAVRGLVEQVSFSRKRHAFLNSEDAIPSNLSLDSSERRTLPRSAERRQGERLPGCAGPRALKPGAPRVEGPPREL